MIKCTHEGCDGELQYRQDLEEKGRFGVFECDKCHCKFGIVSIRLEVGCPSLKGEKKKGTKVWVNVDEGSQPIIKEAFIETKSLSTSDTPIKGKRGRPKGSKNKK